MNDPIKRENTFKSSDKGLESIIDKELSKCNTKNNNPFRKWAKDLKQTLHPKGYMSGK